MTFGICIEGYIKVKDWISIHALIYRFNAVPWKIPAACFFCFFCRNWQVDPKIHMEINAKDPEKPTQSEKEEQS